MFDRGALLMQYCIKYNKFLELGLPEFHERCGNRQREAGQSMQVPGKALRAPTRRVSKTTGRGLPQRTAEGRVMTKSIIAIKTERFRLAGAFTNKEKNCHACTYTPIR